MAVQVLSRLRVALQLDLELSLIFDQPVLAHLAQQLQTSTDLRLPEVESAPRTETMPVSFAQQRLWFLAQISESASRAYNMSLSWNIHGALDKQALRSALNRVMYRHEALRTHFVVLDGRPWQCITASEQVEFALLDRDLRQPGAPTLSACLQVEHNVAFDLQRGPLNFHVRITRDSAATSAPTHSPCCGGCGCA